MRGKEKCKALKEIRRQIAQENDIPYVVSQCTHQGDCKGTCPKCESELRYLERELAIRQGLGKAVAVVGISASVCSGLTACSPVETVKDALGIGIVETAGATTMSEKETDLDGMVPYTEEIYGNLEETPDSGQNGAEEPSGGETGATSPDTSLPEEGGESQSVDEELAGAVPIPFPEGDLVMGEILPPLELEGDIALPQAGGECTAESVSSLEETAQ